MFWELVCNNFVPNGKFFQVVSLRKGVNNLPEFPKDPAVLKILRRSKFITRSKFTTA